MTGSFMHVLPAARPMSIVIVALFATISVLRPLPAHAVDPIPCFLDWSTGFETTQAARFANDISDNCADATTIVWSEKLADAERFLATFSSDDRLSSDLANISGEWKKLVSMVERERDHLAEELKKAATAKPAAAGTATPSSAPKPAPAPAAAPAAASRVPVRFTVPPAYQPWVPSYMKDASKPGAGFRNTVIDVKGSARLRRGGTESQLQPLGRTVVQSGDVLATSPDGEVIIEMDDGSKISLGTSSEIVWANNQPCLKSFSGYPLLIKGVVSWVASGDRLRGCPKAAETRHYSLSVPGGIFTLKYGESNGRGVTTVTVTQGTAFVNDAVGSETIVTAGGSKTFEQPLSAADQSADPAVKAIMNGELLLQGNRLLLSTGAFGIWLDHTKWLAGPADPAVPERRTFDSMDGDVSGFIIYDPSIVSREAIPMMAMSIVQQAGTDVKIKKQEWRKVGPLAVLYLEIEATENGMTEFVIGEYFVGSQGTAAVAVLVAKEDLATHQANINALLNGLVGVNPMWFKSR